MRAGCSTPPSGRTPTCSTASPTTRRRRPSSSPASFGRSPSKWHSCPSRRASRLAGDRRQPAAPPGGVAVDDVGTGGEAGRSADRRLDLQHAPPGGAEVLGQIESREDLLDIVAADVRPDVVPLGIAQQVRDDPGALVARSLAQHLPDFLGGDLLVGEKIEVLGANATLAVLARPIHALSIAGRVRFANTSWGSALAPP